MPTPYEARLMQWQEANRAKADREARRDAQRAQQQQGNQSAWEQYYNFLMQQQMMQQQNAQLAAQQQQSTDLSKEYLDQQSQHRKDVENRYLDILSGRLGTRDRVLADLNQWGQSQVDDTNQRYNNLLTQTNADVHSRGFGGSPGMLLSGRRSVEDARNQSLNRVNDDIISRRANADSSLSDSVFGFMERRNDVPPNLNQLIELQRGLGLSGPLLGSGYQPGGFGGRGVNRFPTQPAPFTGTPTYGNPFLQPASAMAQQFNQQGPALPPGGPFFYGLGGQQPMQSSGTFGSSSLASMPNPDPAPQGDPLAAVRSSAANQEELQRRNMMLGLKQARESRGAGGFGREREAQNMAILAGFANWGGGQPLNLVPGMFGGPIGSGPLMPQAPISSFNRRPPASFYQYGGPPRRSIYQ